MFSDSDEMAKKYPVTLNNYDTKQIISDLKTLSIEKFTWITSPLKYSDYMNWGNIPSETKMDTLIKHNEFEFKNINPHTLITYQKEVSIETILLAMKNINMGQDNKRSYERFPIIKQWNGKNYLIDGNHRAVAALWSNRLLPCRCLNIEIFFDVEPF